MSPVTGTAGPLSFRAGNYRIGWDNGSQTILTVSANVPAGVFYGAFSVIVITGTAHPRSLEWRP